MVIHAWIKNGKMHPAQTTVSLGRFMCKHTWIKT